MKLIVADAYGYGVRSNSDARAQRVLDVLHAVHVGSKIDELKEAYARRTGVSLEAALREKLGGYDEREALALLGII
ncbi:MAG TPA: hypothetical protein VLD86_05120 [Ilumatobacteraceae bacterium]|nr:hypothetical protein [Ilumatobacteraceae bacterium]